MARKTRGELRAELLNNSQTMRFAEIDSRGFAEPFMLGRPIDYWIKIATWLEGEDPELNRLLHDLGEERSARLEAERKLAALKARVKGLVADL